MLNTSGSEIILRDYQEKAIKKAKNNDCLIIGPTGSGKTIVGYILSGLYDKDNYRDIILTQPIKALSEERFYDLKNQGIDVGIETGDNKYNEGARVKVVTQEIFYDKYSKNNNDTVIIDEIHYIFSNPERSRAYLESIYNMNKKTKLILMSATISKPNSFINYLNNLTNRDIKLVEWDNRCVPLEYVIDKEYKLNNKDLHNSIVFGFTVKTLEILANEYVMKSKPVNKHTIKKINEILNYYKVNNPRLISLFEYGCSIYHGKLLPKEKKCIEYLYRNNLINVLFSTDALALGVNLPCETVIFSQFIKGDNSELKPSEFQQLAGRAGRYGFYDIGYVGYLEDCEVNLYEGKRNKLFKEYAQEKLENSKVYSIPDIYNYLIKNDGRTYEDELTLLNRFTYISSNKKNKDEYINNYNKTSLIDLERLYEYCIDSISTSISSNDKIFDEFYELFSDCYIKEYSIMQNIELSEYVYNKISKNPTLTLNCQDIINYNCSLNTTPSEELNGLLYLRRYVKNEILNDKYKVKNVELIDKKINFIDHTVLNIGA